MIVAVIGGVIAFLVVAIVLSRNTSRQKKAAIASLKEEKDAVGHYDIMAMANAEIEELGLRDIEGSEGLSTDVLLKTWKSTRPEVRDCDHASLRYVVAHGIDPENATPEQVRLEREGSDGSAADHQPE